MRKQSAAFSLCDLSVLVAVPAILAALLLPALTQEQDASNRTSCNNNLRQVADACMNYMEPYGDFLPCHWDGNSLLGEQLKRGQGPLSKNDGRTVVQALAAKDPYNNPMQSLALLYPAFIDRLEVFSCPGTADTPKIVIRWLAGSRHSAFGKRATDPKTGKVIEGFIDASEYGGTAKMDPTAASHLSARSKYKSSYLYDSLSHFRDIRPSQAMAADADGFTWLQADGKKAEHPKTWTRKPPRSNHPTGQNVMYFDGHVVWRNSNYSSDDPVDNIYTVELKRAPAANDKTLKWLTIDNLKMHPEVDAWLWDEASIAR